MYRSSISDNSCSDECMNTRMAQCSVLSVFGFGFGVWEVCLFVCCGVLCQLLLCLQLPDTLRVPEENIIFEKDTDSGNPVLHVSEYFEKTRLQHKPAFFIQCCISFSSMQLPKRALER